MSTAGRHPARNGQRGRVKQTTAQQKTAASASSSNRRKNFVVQGSLLAVAGILVRIIGMVYRVPLTAIIGAEGNGYYTSAFSIYSLLLILSSYSMPTAISRIVSGNLAKGRYRNTERVLRAAFVYATGIGFVMFSALWFGGNAIADLLQKPYCAFALKALAPTVWIMAYLGILRGYFQGTGDMVPTAVSQILEQVLNAVISVLAAYILFHRGETANLLYSDTEYTYAFGAAGGCIGTGAGALTALVFFILLYLSHRPQLRRHVRRDESGVDDYRSIGMILALTMVPILISSTVYNISSVIDDYLFGNVQAYLGRAKDIVTEWGIFGEYHILFNIPVALANALSSSLIPSLTRAVEEKNRRDTVSRVRYSIRFTMLIAVPAAIGLCVLAEPVSRMLFPGKNVQLLINLTRVGALAVVFYSLSTISNAILQGLGHLNVPLKNAVIALILHVLALLAMMFAGLGIYAVVLSNILFALVMCILNQRAIRRHARCRIEWGKVLGLPTFAGLVMGAVAYAVYFGVSSVLPESMRLGRIGCAISVLPAVLAAILVYFGVLLALHAFTREDLDNMPMGGRLKRFVR